VSTPIVQPGSIQCTEGSRVKGSQSLRYGAVFTEHDYHCSNTTEFSLVDTAYTKHYAVFPFFDTAYTK